MNSKMNKYIENFQIKINEAIKESNLEYLRNIILDLLRYGLVINKERLIFIASEIKSIISGHLLIIEDFLEDEEKIEEIKLKAFDIAKNLLEFLEKELNDEDADLNLFKSIENSRIETENTFHYYHVRGFPKSKLKVSPDLLELED